MQTKERGREGYHLGPRERAVIAAPLSDRGRSMLRFLAQFQAREGWMPSIRELQDGLGISTTSMVSYYLDHLERDGYLVRARGQSRCMRLTEKGVTA